VTGQPPTQFQASFAAAATPKARSFRSTHGILDARGARPLHTKAEVLLAAQAEAYLDSAAVKPLKTPSRFLARHASHHNARGNKKDAPEASQNLPPSLPGSSTDPPPSLADLPAVPGIGAKAADAGMDESGLLSPIGSGVGVTDEVPLLGQQEAPETSSREETVSETGSAEAAKHTAAKKAKVSKPTDKNVKHTKSGSAKESLSRHHHQRRTSSNKTNNSKAPLPPPRKLTKAAKTDGPNTVKSGKIQDSVGTAVVEEKAPIRKERDGVFSKQRFGSMLNSEKVDRRTDSKESAVRQGTSKRLEGTSAAGVGVNATAMPIPGAEQIGHAIANEAQHDEHHTKKVQPTPNTSPP
jgi:hypothetical protein